MTDDILAPWRADSSRTLIDSPWLRVRAERCVTARGAVLDPYFLIDYPEWVHVAAFDEEDRLLLVRQYRHGARAASLELPGGRMDAHETDPIVAGARELLEETGYVAKTLTHLARLSPNPASHTNGVHVLLGVDARRQAGQSLDHGEDVTVEPMPWRDVARMAARGEIINAQHVGLIFLALAATKGARFGGKETG